MILRNNVSRRSIVPRRTMVRYYVRRDVDIRTDPNALPCGCEGKNNLTLSSARYGRIVNTLSVSEIIRLGAGNMSFCPSIGNNLCNNDSSHTHHLQHKPHYFGICIDRYLMQKTGVCIDICNEFWFPNEEPCKIRHQWQHLTHQVITTCIVTRML